MQLEDGVLYTPQQVSDSGWLGPLTANAIRNAVVRGDFECTRIRRKILFTRANILAIQAAGFQPAKADRPVTASPRRTRRTTSTAEAQPNVRRFEPRPKAQRRREAS
jgi:hypothetical protein